MSPAVLGEKDREGPGETVRDREAYRLNARIELKLGGVVVRATRGLHTGLPPSFFLRLLAPFLGKIPREPRRLRPMGPAALGEKDR